MKIKKNTDQEKDNNEIERIRDIYNRYEFIRNDANQVTGAIFKAFTNTLHLEKLKDE